MTVPCPSSVYGYLYFPSAFVSHTLQFKLFKFSFEQHILYLCLPRIMTFLNAQKFYCNFLEVSTWCAGWHQSSWPVLPVSDCEFLIFSSYSAQNFFCVCVFWSLHFRNLFIFNWRIIDLKYCVGFCHMSTWIGHKYTYDSSVLSIPPTSHPFPLL